MILKVRMVLENADKEARRVKVIMGTEKPEDGDEGKKRNDVCEMMFERREIMNEVRCEKEEEKTDRLW